MGNGGVGRAAAVCSIQISTDPRDKVVEVEVDAE